MTRRNWMAGLGAAASAASAQQILDTKTFPTMGSMVVEDAAFDALFPPNPRLEMIASGFDWTEGPVWDRWNEWLLFSDVPQNTVYRWREGVGVDAYVKPSGYTGRFGTREERPTPTRQN